MSEELTSSIVRILKPDGTTASTGFVVSDEGLIATCAHVVEVAGAGVGDRVRIIFHAAGQEATSNVESEGWCPPEAEDSAFLRLSGRSPKESQE